MRPSPAYEFIKTFKPATVAVVALLALGACGGDSVSMSGSDESSATTTDQQTTLPSSDNGADEDPSSGSTSTGNAIEIANFAYSPAELEAAPGAEITVTNQDEAIHTLTAVDKTVDTGNLEKGQSATISAPQSGELAYFCTIHEYMKGVIRVSG